MMPSKTIPVLFFLMFMQFARCVTESKNEFLENKEKWTSLNISSYSFRMQNTGFLPHNERLINVENDRITSVYLFENSSYVEDSLLYLFKTIDGLFDEVDSAIKTAKKTTVSYNEKYGFPEELYRDYGEEGDGFKVTEFSTEIK